MSPYDTVPSVADPTTEQNPALGVDAPERHLMTRKRVAIAAAVVVVAAGTGTGVYFGTRPSSPTSAASLISVSTEKVAVTTGTMKQTVSASGTLQPAQDSDLTFGVSGTVTAVDVSTGQKVTAGQTLATIGATAISDEVAAAQATVTSDQDKLATDQADSASTSQIDGDQASVTNAESQLSTEQTDLADTTLKATFSGTVAAVDLAVGDAVSGGGGGGGDNSGGSSSTANTAASSNSSSSGITVISSNAYNVSTSVDDTEVGQVKTGDQAVMTLSGSTTQIYGTVSSVSLIASSSSDSSVAAFPVVIAVTGSPSGLFAGASATVSIITEQLNNVVEVPTAAVSYTSGNPTVTEVVSGKDVTQPVTTGITAAGDTQITSGLAAGDTIIERVVKFKGAAGGARTLFGGTGTGTGTGTRTFGGGAGGFGGGAGGFGGGAGG